MNAIGAAENKHRVAIVKDKYRADFELYPPSAVVTLPPTTTPKTGPVILTIAKVMNTVFSEILSSLTR